MNNKVIFYTACVFQFILLFILTYVLVAGLGSSETIVGAFLGLLSGVGTEAIKHVNWVDNNEKELDE